MIGVNLGYNFLEKYCLKFPKTVEELSFERLCPLKRLPSGTGRSVGIATDYGLEGPGIESPVGWEFPPVQTCPGAHPASCTMGTGSFPGVKSGRGVLLTPHPLLVPWSWKGRAISLPNFWTTIGPVTGTLYLYQKTTTQGRNQGVQKKKFSVPWIFHILGARWHLLVLPEEEIVTSEVISWDSQRATWYNRLQSLLVLSVSLL